MPTYIDIHDKPVIFGIDHLEETTEPTEHIIVAGDFYPFIQWIAFSPEHKSQTGMILSVQDNWYEIKHQLQNMPIAIKIMFDTMTSGQGFSLANLLRKRYNYEGPICASKNYSEEQIFLLMQCGFDTFELDSNKDSERVQMLLKQTTASTAPISRVA
ncbi:DUF934 domain-containing protein [Neisseria sp. Ec49-e6-T10]|uniref:DUF934 domain-containing protein n=1 Tax=Neisseria sp. Ec49-e6-T10 TaxID=3140744 RepID=UPI003EB8E34F